MGRSACRPVLIHQVYIGDTYDIHQRRCRPAEAPGGLGLRQGLSRGLRDRRRALEEAARLDRKARRDAKLARAALQQEVLTAYSRGVSKSVLSQVSGMTRQTVDRVLGEWKRKPPKIGKEDETPLTLI